MFYSGLTCPVVYVWARATTPGSLAWLAAMLVTMGDCVLWSACTYRIVSECLAVTLGLVLGAGILASFALNDGPRS